MQCGLAMSVAVWKGDSPRSAGSGMVGWHSLTCWSDGATGERRAILFPHVTELIGIDGRLFEAGAVRCSALQCACDKVSHNSRRCAQLRPDSTSRSNQSHLARAMHWVGLASTQTMSAGARTAALSTTETPRTWTIVFLSLTLAIPCQCDGDPGVSPADLLRTPHSET